MSCAFWFAAAECTPIATKISKCSVHCIASEGSRSSCTEPPAVRIFLSVAWADKKRPAGHRLSSQLGKGRKARGAKAQPKDSLRGAPAFARRLSRRQRYRRDDPLREVGAPRNHRGRRVDKQRLSTTGRSKSAANAAAGPQRLLQTSLQLHVKPAGRSLPPAHSPEIGRKTWQGPGRIAREQAVAVCRDGRAVKRGRARQDPFRLRPR